MKTIEDEFALAYSDYKYCIFEIENVRKQFSNLSKENFSNLVKGIGYILLFCPEDLKPIVLALFDELRIRYNMEIEKEKIKELEKLED